LSFIFFNRLLGFIFLVAAFTQLFFNRVKN